MGQSSSTPFMSIRDGYHHRWVSFDMKEELGGKIDKLAVMIDKLAIRDSGTYRQFKPQIHQSRGRIEATIKETIRKGTGQITGQTVEIDDS